MCFQRDRLSHEIMETIEYDEYSGGLSSAHIEAGPRKRDGNLHQPTCWSRGRIVIGRTMLQGYEQMNLEIPQIFLVVAGMT